MTKYLVDVKKVVKVKTGKAYVEFEAVEDQVDLPWGEVYTIPPAPEAPEPTFHGRGVIKAGTKTRNIIQVAVEIGGAEAQIEYIFDFVLLEDITDHRWNGWSWWPGEKEVTFDDGNWQTSIPITEDQLETEVELEYLKNNKIYFMDWHGDSAMRNDHSRIWTDRISYVAGVLGIPDPVPAMRAQWQAEENAKFIEVDFQLVKVEAPASGHLNNRAAVDFVIEEEKIYILIAGKRMLIDVPLSISQKMPINWRELCEKRRLGRYIYNCEDYPSEFTNEMQFFGNRLTLTYRLPD